MSEVRGAGSCGRFEDTGQFLPKFLPRDPATVLLCIYPDELETYTHTKHARGCLWQLYSEQPRPGCSPGALQQVTDKQIVVHAADESVQG